MRLHTKCKSCKKEIRIISKAQSRPDLIESHGEYFRKRCEHCAMVSEYHVNEVMALDIGNIPGNIAGILIVIIVTVFFWNNGWVTNVGLVLGLGVILASNASSLTSNAKLFNQYYIQATEKD